MDLIASSKGRFLIVLVDFFWQLKSSPVIKLFLLKPQEKHQKPSAPLVPSPLKSAEQIAIVLPHPTYPPSPLHGPKCCSGHHTSYQYIPYPTWRSKRCHPWGPPVLVYFSFYHFFGATRYTLDPYPTSTSSPSDQDAIPPNPWRSSSCLPAPSRPPKGSARRWRSCRSQKRLKSVASTGGSKENHW